MRGSSTAAALRSTGATWEGEDAGWVCEGGGVIL